jgi:hypothetical protein
VFLAGAGRIAREALGEEQQRELKDVFDGKHLISPEAVVEGGRLRSVDPETCGIDLLREAYKRPWAKLGWDPLTGDALKWVAMPEEISFGVRDRHARSHPAGNHLIAHELHPWKEVREDHDALFVMDKDGSRSVSVLYRREDAGDWEHQLGNLLIPSDEPEHQTARHMGRVAHDLDRDLTSVSPTARVGRRDGSSRAGAAAPCCRPCR